MAQRFGSALLVSALVLCGSASLAFAADTGPGTITVSPSRTLGTASAGKTYGAITLSNTTTDNLAVVVVPSLLRQSRAGGIFVDTTPTGFRRAAHLIEPQVKKFTLPANGSSRSTLARLLRLPRSGSFYGGLLFETRPIGTNSGEQIQQVFRINGSLYLDPSAKRAHVRFGGEPMRGEQAAPRVITLVTPVVNRGNWALPVSGSIEVRDSNGRVRYRDHLRSPDLILPKAVVELRSRMSKPVLPAGVYRLIGRWRTGHGERFRTSGVLRLFGPNTVATRDADVTTVKADTAYIDEPLKVHATFTNTGNVPFAPRLQITVLRLDRGKGEAVVDRKSVQPSAIRPGADATTDAAMMTPKGKAGYTVRVEAFEGRRLLDTRSISVTPIVRPSFLDRLKDHLLLIIVIVLALIIALLLLALWRRRRDDDEPRAPAPPAPAPIPAVAVPVQTPAAPRDLTVPSPAATPNGELSLNSASVEQLMTLPGLGRLAAERIVAYREANGPLETLEELRNVEGFHQERIARLAPHVRV